jgi:diguanylate cyclase (GGDEF)-like protein
MRVKHQMRIINLIREIQSLSITDALTGIGNRRYFNNLLHQEWARARRQQSPLSFILLDIDNFKSFNDEYGHLNGDAVLQSVARVAKAIIARATDKIARWGGEEFAVILAAIEAAVITLDKEDTCQVTVSIGVHTTIPERDMKYTINEFISDADKALYHAKRTGKNRVCAVGEV